MNSKKLKSALLALLVSTTAMAAEVVCEGVLGNSGEQGASLVRFGAEQSRGIGVAYDRFGALWDRAGKGVLNRYAADGRLLAAYRIPTHENGNDQIAIAGDTLVLLLGGRLHTLKIDAAAGSEAVELKLEARCISFAVAKGAIAYATPDQVLLLDPLTGTSTPVAPFKEADGVEIAGDGSVLAFKSNQAHRLGAAVAGWPRASPGERTQCLDGWWYGHAWHGTIRRADGELDPSPGVVLGGASGSFIGHLDQNSELSNSRGMARLWDGVFALSGIHGVLQLAAWDGARKQFAIERRIGAVQACRGLGLDRDGRVYHFSGHWLWSDGPDAPLRAQNVPPEGLGQVVMLDDQRLVAPTWLWGKPGFLRCAGGNEPVIDRIERVCALPRDTVGTAVYPGDGGWTMLTILADGKTAAFALEPDGRYLGERGTVALATAQPVTAWTSLAFLAGAEGGTLLGAGDGQVIAFTRAGEGWRETRRWNSWGAGPDQRFGAHVHLSSDGRTLVVADRERQRVLGFARDGGVPRWSFGALDRAGSDLATLDRPETVAVQGGRVVVYDAGNQRLLKLRTTVAP